MRPILFAVLCAVAGSAWAQLVDLPVSRVKIGRACDQRTITWSQEDPRPASWTVEFRQIFSANGQPSFDTPIQFSVPGTAQPRWQGMFNHAGVFQVRVRSEYVENGQPKPTSWAESTVSAQVLNGQSFVMVLFLCPPGGFEPN